MAGRTKHTGLGHSSATGRAPSATNTCSWPFSVAAVYTGEPGPGVLGLGKGYKSTDPGHREGTRSRASSWGGSCCQPSDTEPRGTQILRIQALESSHQPDLVFVFIVWFVGLNFLKCLY